MANRSTPLVDVVLAAGRELVVTTRRMPLPYDFSAGDELGQFSFSQCHYWTTGGGDLVLDGAMEKIEIGSRAQVGKSKHRVVGVGIKDTRAVRITGFKSKAVLESRLEHQERN